MLRITGRLFLLLGLGLALFGLLGCDHGLSPELFTSFNGKTNQGTDTIPTDTTGSDTVTTGISGLVTFHGTWPPTTEEVWVIAVEPPYVSHLMSQDFVSTQLPLFVDSARYVFPLQPKLYEVVAVVGRRTGEDWTLNSLLGYMPNPTNPSGFYPVTVEEGIIIPDINITADFTRWH